jgi:hypothetical protein
MPTWVDLLGVGEAPKDWQLSAWICLDLPWMASHWIAHYST